LTDTSDSIQNERIRAADNVIKLLVPFLEIFGELERINILTPPVLNLYAERSHLTEILFPFGNCAAIR